MLCIEFNVMNLQLLDSISQNCALHSLTNELAKSLRVPISEQAVTEACSLSADNKLIMVI